jgi:UDP-N-acetylmuramyl pentapeptide synthase
MKKICKCILIFMLALVAKLVLRRYRPHIVMVTGSVGKTSTKDAVAAVLSTQFFIRKSEKSFNSEFGVPFTILGVGNPWDDPFEWFHVAKSVLALLLLPNHYPNMLVLETGADRPGDLSWILRFATPDAVIVTRLPEVPVHVEAYSSPEAVREEEFSPAYALPAEAPLIISADDPYARERAKSTPARVISYGVSEDADVRLSDAGFYEARGKVAGMQANVNMKSLPAQLGKKGKLVVKGSVGNTQLYPAAAALATASVFGIPLSDALATLKKYEPPPGRGRLFSGVHGSLLIDDSYNASPVAVEEALSTLKAFPNAKRRIAILGDMLELGRYSVIEHERIAELASEAADIIIAVGIRARTFAAASKQVEVMQFDNSYDAARALPSLIQEGDVVLVKGSQSIRTERIVEALLVNPTDASQLVRQEKKWKQKR